MEIRSFCDTASPKLVEEITIEGYALVFGVESRVLYDKSTKRCFIERINRGAITEDLLQRCDVKALLEHNRDRMLARSVNGKGSLTLSVDEHGVKYRFIAPDTVDGNYAVEMIKRGDLFGSSFAFLADDKQIKYSKRSDGMLMRDINKITVIADVSVVSDPAYLATDVSVRSMDAIEKEFDPADESYKNELNELRKSINNEL